MHPTPFRLTAGALALVLTGCATTGSRLPVRGRNVSVETRRGEARDHIQGELLAVSPDLVLVLGKEGLRKVPRVEIERVRVELHELGGRKAGTWVVVGALVSGAALAIACGSAEAEGCGGMFAFAGLGWGLLGAPSAVALQKSSRVFIEASELDTLRSYARFPQGLPEGLDPAQLVVASGSSRAPGPRAHPGPP